MRLANSRSRKGPSPRSGLPTEGFDFRFKACISRPFLLHQALHAQQHLLRSMLVHVCGGQARQVTGTVV